MKFQSPISFSHPTKQWPQHPKRILVYVLYLLQYNCRKYEFRRSSKFGCIVKKLMKGQRKKKWKPAACSGLTEVLLLLQRPPSEACSLLIIPFPGCCTAPLRPKPSVIAYHFTFFQVWPCLFLLLILSIVPGDNQPRCCSLWPWEALPPRLTHLLKSAAFQHRDKNPATMTEHSQPVGPVCLTSDQKKPGWVCQRCVCCAWLFIMNGKFCKNCPFLWAMITACLCVGKRVFFCLSRFDASPLLAFLVCQRDCQMDVKMETTDNDHHIWSFLFLFFF